MRMLLALVALAPLVVGRPVQTVAQQYQVIVNAGNPVSELPASEVDKLFQRRRSSWDHGGSVVPIDLPEDSPVRSAFSQDVYGKSVAAIKAYWQRQIFSGRGVPPVVKANDAEVIAMVQSDPGAIGYVSSGARLGTGVKALRIAGR